MAYFLWIYFKYVRDGSQLVRYCCKHLKKILWKEYCTLINKLDSASSSGLRKSTWIPNDERSLSYFLYFYATNCGVSKWFWWIYVLYYAMYFGLLKKFSEKKNISQHFSLPYWTYFSPLNIWQENKKSMSFEKLLSENIR